MDVLWFRAGKRADENESVFARRRARQDDGDVRPRRLLAMRLCHRQGTVRRGEGARARRAAATTSCGMAPVLKSGHRRREELGRRQAADGGDQPPEALDPARAALHRRCRACDVAGRRRRRQPRGAGCGRDREPAGGEAGERLPVRGRTGRRATTPRISGADDAADAGGGAEQHHQRGAEAGRRAAQGRRCRCGSSTRCRGCRGSPRASSASACGRSMCIRRRLVPGAPALLAPCLEHAGFERS